LTESVLTAAGVLERESGIAEQGSSAPLDHAGEACGSTSRSASTCAMVSPCSSVCVHVRLSAPMSPTLADFRTRSSSGPLPRSPRRPGVIR
jgi:hypothetical protein